MIFWVGQKKKFYFFNSLSSSVFLAFIGTFAFLWMIFSSLSLVFFNPLYYQFSFFLFWGIAFFSVSYFFYIKKYEKILRNLNYEAFLVARNKLISWMFWTLNFYLMSCWFLLILIGVFEGFNFKFPIGDKKAVLLYSTASITKITGVVFWSVHIFAIFLLKMIFHYWRKIIFFAHKEFSKRRKVLETVRQEAEAQI